MSFRLLLTTASSGRFRAVVVLPNAAFAAATTASSTTSTIRRRFKSTRPEPSSSSPSALIDGRVTDFFSSMRWKAANALTASLSPDERDRLLERIQQPERREAMTMQQQQQRRDGEEAPLVAENSIAEAVAAARAQEARRQQEKWNEEKESILEQARLAAEARVESELAVQKQRAEAFRQWQRDVDLERMELQQQQQEATEANGSVGQQQKQQQQQQQEHPVLGPVVADLGYKRVHLVSARALSAIPVWKKQRIYRHDRAKLMAADKLKTLHLGMPGIIGLHEVRVFCMYVCVCVLATVVPINTKLRSNKCFPETNTIMFNISFLSEIHSSGRMPRESCPFWTGSTASE